MWKTVGWGTIIYLAAMAGVDMEQYEAAFIDGASRFQIIKSITLPSILPVISIVFILNLGGILNAGFDQIFNLYNPTVYKTGDIIDTYVYRVGFINMDYSFSTAVNLFKNLIGLFLVVSSNAFIRRFNDGENALW
jgi:putative aldouronate transport system permease protein